MSLCQIPSLACEWDTIPGPDIGLFQSSIMNRYYYFENRKISFDYFKRKAKDKATNTPKVTAYKLEESQKTKKIKKPLLMPILRNLVSTSVDTFPDHFLYRFPHLD